MASRAPTVDLENPGSSSTPAVPPDSPFITAPGQDICILILSDWTPPAGAAPSDATTQHSAPLLIASFAISQRATASRSVSRRSIPVI